MGGSAVRARTSSRGRRPVSGGERSRTRERCSGLLGPASTIAPRLTADKTFWVVKTDRQKRISILGRYDLGKLVRTPVREH
ncbi:MAG: hypothetical protein JWM82_4111, partial [Myxococcales bacterium]|nr:hypothetical protein [Myxococcales bacterium]